MPVKLDRVLEMCKSIFEGKVLKRSIRTSENELSEYYKMRKNIILNIGIIILIFNVF